MMKKLLLLTPFFFFATALSAQLQVSAETYATGVDNPVDIVHCGDDRLFIVERDGTIRIIQADGTVLPTPFLDIDSQVNSNPNEQGLLGLAFHPDYLNNGQFFVNYTIGSEDSRVSRFTVSDTDPNVADPNSEEILIAQNQPYWNHNGGCLKFGPDGYLYASFGDGGSGGDPQDNGQKLSTMLGKLLRIDVDGASGYTIPADNPFVGNPDALDEIWAYGLRNPWRFSFDAVTGDIWIGDVGQNAWEEVDFQPASSTGGENYGWRCHEGLHNYSPANCNVPDRVEPVMEYQNTPSVGCSVTGGLVYRGCEFPEMYGHYIFGDYCSGRIWRITPDGNGGWANDEVANVTDNQIAAFGENSAGQLFVAYHGNGQIRKIVPTGDLLQATDESCAGSADGSVDFTIPTDQFASVNWSDGATDANRTDLAPGTYDVTVTTTNGCVFEDGVEVMDGVTIVPPTISLDMDSILTAEPGADSYQWLLNGQPIEDATDLTYTAQENGNYSVVITIGDCVATSTEIPVMVASDVLESLGLSSFSLTPNPFNNDLELRASSSQMLDLEVVVIDLNGKEFLRQQAQVNGGYAKTFDLSNLPSGIYFFKMKTQNGEWSEQVVKN